MRHRWGLWAVALCVLATGCELGVDIDLAVTRAGSGTLALTVAADAELLAFLDEGGTDPLGALAGAGARLRGDGWRTEDEPIQGGGRRVTLVRGFTDPDDLAEVVDDLVASLDAPELALLEELRLTVEGRRVALDGVVGLIPGSAVADLGLTPLEAVQLLGDANASVVVRARLPGELLETSGAADSVRDGSIVEWVVEPGERVTVRAVSEVPPSPVPWLIAAGVLGALISAVLLRRAEISRRRRSRQATWTAEP